MKRSTSLRARPLVASFRLLGSALLGVLMLSACGGGSTPPPVSAQEYQEYTVEVTDQQYNVTFSYTTNRNFAYAFTPLADYPQSAAEAEMLRLVNVERAKGGSCPLKGGGTQNYAPTTPLTFEGHLHKAATLYAKELASTGKMDLPHRSPLTGFVPSQRVVLSAGYKPLPPNDTAMIFHESLAAELGEIAPEKVIAAWKGSVDHCAALYEPMKSYSHGSVAQVRTRIGDQDADYWVLNTAGY